MNYPAVTIGVTTYNAQETILEVLNSAANQSVEIAQIVVVDDKSTDDTLKIVEQFDLYPEIEIFQNSINSGVAVSRNVIIDHAKGDFIAFFDDDDFSLPNRIEAQLKRILNYEQEFSNGAPVLCHTARKQLYPNGDERIEPTMGIRLGQKAPSGPAVARRALMGEPLEDGYGSCATCSQMGRTDLYRMLGGFDPIFRRCEDADLAIRLAIEGGHFVGIADPLVVQKMTPTSDKTLDQLRVFMLMLLEKHEYFFESKASYQFCRDWTDLKCDWLGNDRIPFASKLAVVGFRYPVLTAKRLMMALPNFFGNRAFRLFQSEVE